MKTNAQRPVIAVDIGRSAVKVVYTTTKGEVGRFDFPCAAMRAFSLTDDAALISAKADTVLVSGVSYFVGTTAVRQSTGETLLGLQDDWVKSPEHLALFLGALQKVAREVGIQNALVVVGLPARLYATKSGYQAALAACIERDMGGLGLTVRVLSQSMGPFYDIAISDQGRFVDEMSQVTCAIVEIGQFTTDIAFTEHGVPVESTFASTDGMRVVAEYLQRLVQSQHGVWIDLSEATDSLATGSVRKRRESLNVEALIDEASKPLVQKIEAKMNQVFGSRMRTVTHIIVAGGGAKVLGTGLRAIDPDIVVPEDPRYCVAMGFYKWGVAALLLQAAA